MGVNTKKMLFCFCFVNWVGGGSWLLNFDANGLLLLFNSNEALELTLKISV